jgi:hypothetical protein
MFHKSIWKDLVLPIFFLEFLSQNGNYLCIVHGAAYKDDKENVQSHCRMMWTNQKELV